MEFKKSKPGGLDSWDESRSRSRFLDLLRWTLRKCRDFLDYREKLFLSPSRFLKSRLFSWDFVMLRFLLRLSRRIEIVKICWDISRFVRKSWHYGKILSTKMMKSFEELRILMRNMQKSTYFLIEIEMNCQEMTKFWGHNKLLSLDRDFWVWT